MANKRAHQPDSESEESDISSRPSSQKRQRTRSALDNAPSMRLANAAKRNSNGKEDGEDSDGYEEDEDEDARTQMKVNELKEKVKSQKTGSIAQSGVIEKVELTNFMCHKLHTTTFKPQINFIIGHNGSGKSAVLTAITLALGGKASTTNRGTNLKSFIKEGETRAHIAVTLKNQGSEAYEPEKYGKSIIVERIIDSAGNGGYKIKNSNGKIISTKKEELNKITDQFGIQVDNPITVLSQDASRQFLSTSSPKDKYNFFMRGTQLTQLEQEYNTIRDHAENSANALAAKKAALPELKNMVKESKEKLMDIEVTKKSADKLEELKREKAWSYVILAEEDIQKASIILNREKTKEGRYKAEIEKQLNALARCEEELQAAEQDREVFDNDEQLAREKEAIKKEQEENRNQLKRLIQQEREFASEYQEIESIIASFKTQIAEASRKMDNLTVQQDREQKIKDLETQRAHAANLIGDLKAQISELEKKQQDLSPEFQALQNATHQAKQRVTEAKLSLQDFERIKSETLGAYGKEVIALCQSIDADRSWREKPIGPLGRYIKLKNQKWSNVIETVLNPYLNAFVVQNDEDMKRLRGMMMKFKVTWCTVIKQRYDPSFDCSRGEPDSKFLTLLRILTFEHLHVRNVLVDGARIESTILVEKGDEADDVMRYTPPNVTACYSLGLYRHGGIEGGAQAIALQKYTHTPRLTQDIQIVLEGKRQRVNQAIEDQREINTRFEQMNSNLTALNRQLEQIKSRLSQVQAKNKRDGEELNRLQDEVRQDQPDIISNLQDQLAVVEADLANRDIQYQALAERKAAISEKAHPLVRRKEEIERIEAEQFAKVRAYDERTSKLATSQAIAQNHVQHYRAKLEEHSATIRRLQTQFDSLVNDLGKKTNEAEMQSEERPRNVRKATDRIQKEIQTIEKHLKDREKRQGASADQIRMEFETRQRNLQEATKTVKQIQVFIQALNNSLAVRLSRWMSFRYQIGRRAKANFLLYLSLRGFSGKLSFDHDTNRLHLRIQTEDTTSKGRDKDPKSLSGGEKSFSTIALLLCLWEAVGCPIRALDEFDVFQDAVNRRISMKMMVDTAKLAHETQFILITPQDMSTTAMGPETHIVRMNGIFLPLQVASYLTKVLRSWKISRNTEIWELKGKRKVTEWTKA